MCILLRPQRLDHSWWLPTGCLSPPWRNWLISCHTTHTLWIKRTRHTQTTLIWTTLSIYTLHISTVPFPDRRKTCWYRCSAVRIKRLHVLSSWVAHLLAMLSLTWPLMPRVQVVLGEFLKAFDLHGFVFLVRGLYTGKIKARDNRLAMRVSITRANWSLGKRRWALRHTRLVSGHSLVHMLLLLCAFLGTIWQLGVFVVAKLCPGLCSCGLLLLAVV